MKLQNPATTVGRSAILSAAMGLAIAAPQLSAATIDKADNTDNLDLTSSWTGGLVPGTVDVAQWSGLAGANSVLLGSNLSVRGLTVATTGGAVTIGAGNTLTLGTSGIDMSAASQDLTISSNLALGAGGRVWNVASGRTLTLNTGTFTRATGATLNLQGTGTVAASMTGLANDGSLGTAGTGILGAWATVGTGTGTRYATLSGGNIVGYTTANPATTGTPGWGSTAINSGTGTTNFDIGAATATTYGGSTRSANTIRYTAGAGTLTLGNSGSGAQLITNGIINAGTGTLTLNTTSAVTAAGLAAGASMGIVLHAANAAIDVSARIHNNTGGASSVTVVGPNTVTFSGANDYTGGTFINSGKLVATVNGLNGGAINVASGGTLTFTGNNQTSTSTVTGGGAILNDSANTIVFTGDHSGFTGSFVHNAASNNTQFNSATAGSQNASYALNAGELIFAANGNYTVKFGSLASAANQTIRGGNSATGTATLEVGNLNTSTSLLGSLNNGTNKVLALNKVGSGTLTLANAANTYSGGTTVSAGTLLINGVLGSTSNSVSVTGGTLGGSGSIGGSVAISGTGSLSPGNSIESLGIGALSMTAGTTLFYEAANSSATGADLVAVDGVLSLSGVNLSLDAGTMAALASGSFGMNDKITLLSYKYNGINEVTSGFTDFLDGAHYSFGLNEWVFDYNDSDFGDNFAGDAIAAGQDRFVTMTLIPEPSAALLGGLGLLALLRRRRK